MNNDSHRVISISMTEQEWQAFVRIHPQPVLWLRERIQESIALGGGAIAPVSVTGGVNTTSATTR
jgi:hypothetical protein